MVRPRDGGLFSRRDAAGVWRCDGAGGAVLYHELTVLADLRRRAPFVPGIYVTNPRSMLLARHYYGMPKSTTAMRFSQREGHVEAGLRAGTEGERVNWVRARLLGSGAWAGRVLSRLVPLRSWPVDLPAETRVRATILAVPRAQPAFVRAGELSVPAP